MNPFIVIIAALGIAGVSVQEIPLQYHFSWNTRGPAIVQQQARGSWTIEATAGDADIAAPQKVANNSLGVDITARSAVILDKESGAVLWEKNKDEVRAIGSITKLMTALVFLEHNPGWNETFAVTPEDRTVGGKQHLFTNDPITVRDLFNTSLIASDNDATVVLARSTGLSDEAFVQAMNDKAKNLGLTATRFADVTGLSDNNVATAVEVIVLGKTAFSQPDIKAVANEETYSFTSASGKDYEIESTNRLLGGFIDITAAKTGFINLAGYCIVAEVEDNGHTVLVAILGSDTNTDRFQDVKMLSYWAWQNFTWL